MSEDIQEEVQIKRARKPRETKADDAELVAVRLLRNYRPFGLDEGSAGDFLIERDGDIQAPGINEEGQEDRSKVKAGTVIHIPRSEARRALKHGIAERADEI